MKRPRWWVTHQRLPLGFGFLGFLCSQKAFLRLSDMLFVLRRLLGLKPVETEMTRLKITEIFDMSQCRPLPTFGLQD